MDDQHLARVLESAAFKSLARQRRRLGFGCAALLLGAYIGFALSSVLAPEVLGSPLGAGGVFSKGIFFAVGVCVCSVLAAAWYTHRSNKTLDALEREVADSLKSAP